MMTKNFKNTMNENRHDLLINEKLQSTLTTFPLLVDHIFMIEQVNLVINDRLCTNEQR